MDLDGRRGWKDLEGDEVGETTKGLCDEKIFSIRKNVLSCVDYIGSPIYLNHKPQELT